MSTTIYHNPRCGTSRTVLQILRETGIEPVVVEYLRDPPSRQALQDLIRRSGLTVREAVRAKEPLYKELGLDAPDVSDQALLDAMVANPILINRPFVSTPKGARLCRPAEVVREIL
jgi:arsenate reductase (glutaredoxin)